MYPSPRLLYTESVASPKKKPRPNVLRQLYALPAIHQFEPVLSSHSTAIPSSPRSGFQVSLREEAQSSTPPLSPMPSQTLPAKEGKGSPRFRPQPPPPLSTATASRTDQDLFRYSQGVKQRMAIRPLFEQRREEEADIARRILASRETESGLSRQGLQTESDGIDRDAEEERRVTPRQHTHEAMHSSPRRATTPVTASEIAEQRASPRSGVNTLSRRGTPRAKCERTRLHDEEDQGKSSGSLRDRNGREEADAIAIASVRFRTPTPPASAGPKRILIAESAAVNSNAMTSDEDLTSEVEAPFPVPDAGTTPTSDTSPRQEDTAQEVHAGGSLVSPLSESTLHTPFLDTKGSKLNWLACRATPAETPATRSRDTTAAIRGAPVSVCYKLLWKETKPMGRKGDLQAATFDLRVLLGSNGRAHISIQPLSASSSEEDSKELKLLVSETDVVLSAKARPDLAVMTPHWARWILSRLERDVHGVWFLRIQDIAAMGDACVFTGDITIKVVASLSTETVGDDANHTVSVSIYLLGEEGTDAEALLVHARNRSAAVPTLTEVVLKQHELLAITASLGCLVSPSDSGEMRGLLRDQQFLQRAIAESKAVRLALGSGLHITEATNSAWELPFRTGSRAAQSTTATGTETGDGEGTIPTNEPRKVSNLVAEFEAQGLTYATPEIQRLLRASEPLAEMAFLAQAYYEDAAAATLRWLQREQAVDTYVASYVHGSDGSDPAMSDAVRRRIATAKRAKLEDMAARSIVDDMLLDFITVECRVALHHAKYSGGYADHYASKVQAAFRMSHQRRDYVAKRNTRLRAARLIQALQRGILARRRYCEMRVEREKYLFYGFRSSLHQATASMEDPRARATAMARETERRRQTYLMQVLHGYVTQHDGLTTAFRIAPELVQRLFNEYGVVVGCTPTCGDAVANILITSRPTQAPKTGADAPRLFGSGEIHAALVTALRQQYDETFGLSSAIRQLEVASPVQQRATTEEPTPPRWLLKASPSFQRANRNRLACVRLTRKAAGQRAAHLVALDYRSLLRQKFATFESCRALWEDAIHTRTQQARVVDALSVDDLVQHALDRLMLAVKDWGLDPEPLFDALNLCLVHRLGRQAMALTEQAFDAFARGVNERHGKRSVLPLREEIAHELEEIEALVALRCLNLATDSVTTVAPSELLCILLRGSVDDEYVRHALPSVLPVASVPDKVALAHKMLGSYANAAYGDAFNAICRSCLDSAESVTVEAAQFLERITRAHDADKATLAARALYVLTGAQALRFLQFLAKVAHFTRPLQRRVLEHLAEHTAQDLELYRFASVVCAIDSFEVVTRLFDASFRAASVHRATRFWVHYGVLYGEARAEEARASCAPRGDAETDPWEPETAEEELRGILQEPITA